MHLSRRQMLLTATAATLLPHRGFALSVETSESMVTSLVAEVNAVIASGRSEAQMIADFAQLFDKYSDVPTIARYCLGADARSATAAEMQTYTTAFRH